MITFLFLLMPKIETYEIKKVEINYDYGIILEERWLDSVFIGFKEIKTLTSYLGERARESIIQRWLESTREKLGEKAAESLLEGLIPKIKIPGFEEETSIDIRGSDKITIGMGGTYYPQGKSFSPEPSMEQLINVNVEGIIARKTKVEMDYSSEREIQAENTIRISYEGDEDEVTEYVKAGDIALTMPTTALTGGIPTHKGLFGFSGKWNVGPITLYAIASKEEASAITQRFTHGLNVEERKDSIYDHQYEKNTFFKILNDSIKALLGDDTVITNVGLYVWDNNFVPEGKIPLNVVASPYAVFYDSIQTPETEIKANFYPLERNKDFYFHAEAGIIEMLTRFSEGYYTLAAACTTSKGTELFQIKNDTVVMLLIWPQHPDSSFITWGNELRNYYNIGETGIDPANLKVKIVRISPGEPTEVETSGPNKGKTFLEILGLDPDGDGKVSGEFIDPSRGLLHFPYAEPFNSPELSVRDSSIYLTRNIEIPKYQIIFSYTKIVEFQLPLGTEEGTVRVIVGDEELSPEDYDVDYAKGVIRLKEKFPPGTEIKIVGEQKMWFATREGSIAGVRAETNTSEDTKIGATFLYRNEKERGVIRPSIGTEPYSRAIGAFDMKIQKELEGITEFIDRLPVLETDVPSEIQAEADLGVSIPNPNTAGVAYLEDFEGVEESDEVGVTAKWYPTSLPASKSIEDTINYSRNPVKMSVVTINKKEIYGEETGDIQQDFIDILKIVYTPEDSLRWSGVMTALGTGEVFDITQKDNLRFIFKTDAKKGKIYIDFGSDIDEDMLRLDKNGVIRGLDTLNTEDKNGNFRLDEYEGEDTGLDGVFGGDDKNVPGDDGNDDYDKVKNIMGTEGNNSLDTEDMDKDGWNGGGLKRNDYYEVMLSLSEENKYIKDLKNGWKLLTVPLADSSFIEKFGAPNQKLINEFRIWFENMEGTNTIYVHEFKFQGTVWRGLSVYKEDTLAAEVDTSEKVSIAPVNREIDPGYTSPFKLRREIGGQYELENSLELTYENIKEGHGVKLYKYTPEPLDLRGYKKLSLYINPKENDVWFFLRIGTDSLNYYEYRGKTDKGKNVEYGEGWKEFEIELNEFSKVKKDSLENDTIKYVGIPSLSNIRYFSIGIINPKKEPISGRIWFNDIRVENPWKEKGISFTTKLRLKLADLVETRFSFSRSDPNFVSFTDPTGVKTGGLNNSLSLFSRANFEKLFPKRWGLNLPFTLSYTKRQSLPKFSPYFNDYRIKRKEAENFIEGMEKKGFTFSFSKQKSKNKIANYTVDAISFSTNGSMTHNLRNATKNLDSLVTFQTTTSYGIAPKVFFEVWKNKIYLFPERLNISLTQSYSSSKSFSRLSPQEPFTNTLRDERRSIDLSSSFSQKILDRFLSLEGSFTNKRDMREPHYLKGVNIGRDAYKYLRLSSRLSNISFNEFGTPSVSFSTEYDENHSKEIQMDTFDTRNIRNGSTFTAGWSGINLGGIFEKIKNIFPSKDTGVVKGSPLWLFDKFTQIIKRINPISLNYSFSRSSYYEGYLFTPSKEYIFGIEDSIPLYDEHEAIQYLGAGSRTRTHNISLNTGTNIGGLDADVRISQDISYTLTFGQTNFTFSRTLPSLSLRFYEITKHLKKIAPALQSASIQSSFERRITYSGNIAPDTTGNPVLHVNSTTQSMNFQPLVSLSTYWKRNINATLSINYQDTKTYSDYGDLGFSIHDQKIRSYELSGSYSFSAPSGLKIPWLKNVRFTNNLNLNLTYKFTRNQDITYVMEKETEEVTSKNVNIDEDRIEVTIGGTYNFSNTFDGGLNLIYQKRDSRRSNTLDFSTYNLQIIVTIRF